MRSGHRFEQGSHSWRLVSLAALASLGVLAWAPSAWGAVTQSQVTAPSNPAFITYNFDNPNNVTISGTSNGTTGDQVDLLCYDGPNGYKTIASGVPVGTDGSFSTTVAASSFTPSFGHGKYPNWTCVLRAVAAGTTPSAPPGAPSPFSGPRVSAGEHQTFQVGAKLLLQDFYVARAQRGGLMDYHSLGGCGLDDSYVFDRTNFGPDEFTGPPNNPLFYCNDYLWWANGTLPTASTGYLKATRSELQVDGRNAYLPGNADRLNVNSGSYPSYPALRFHDAVDHATGNLKITESEHPVICEPHPGVFPPTSTSCSRFKREHVKFRREISQRHDGRFVLLNDRWSSTDHRAHKIDLQLENDVHGGDTGFKFPWVSRHFHTHTVGDTIPGPHHAPRSIFIKESLAAANGDESHPRGAITFSSPPRGAKFIVDESATTYDAFVLHYRRKVPARGATHLGFIYSDSFTSKQVAAFVRQAERFFRTH